jgi:trehalose 6-phosphate phosphatase
VCLFLDVDGTILEFTDTPSSTAADDDIKALLSACSRRVGGAMALISGREIRTMDALFAPQTYPMAGLHGVERRDAKGRMHGNAQADPQLDGLRRSLKELTARYPGSIVEDKGRSIAVHYRLSPEHAKGVESAFEKIAQPLLDRFELQHGLLNLELKPRGVSKGTAIAAFLSEAPFLGRTPVFAGDDLTDRFGFAVVDSAAGWSVGVGERVRGRYQLRDVAAVRAWLGALVA